MGINFKKIFVFLGLTFSINWLMAILFFAFGGRWGTIESLVMAAGYMLVPMIVAIIVQKFIYKKALIKPLGISFKPNRWFLIAWLLPPVIAFATLGVSLLFAGTEYNTEITTLLERYESILTEEQLQQMQNKADVFHSHPILMGLLLGLVAGITINAVAAFGEELGWRGFLQKELGFLGFWKSSLVIGVIWGIWHGPIILQGHNYPLHPLMGVFMMVVLCVLLAPIFSYIRLKAKSVIAAAIIHGTLNGTAGISILAVKGGNDLIVGITGLAGFIVLGLVNIVLLLYDRMLAKEPILIG